MIPMAKKEMVQKMRKKMWKPAAATILTDQKPREMMHPTGIVHEADDAN